MTAKFITGDALDILRTLPNDFFHTAVSSPPYWGLRSYDNGIKTWDADPDCKHEWEDNIPRASNEYREDKGSFGTLRRSRIVQSFRMVQSGGPSKKQDSVRGSRFIGETSSFCLKCSAWRGQLGAEPDPRLYIKHLISIMREVRRVLRKDGVLWLNIGDSWAGSGGYHLPHHYNESGFQSKGRNLLKGGRPIPVSKGLKPLDMVLIPQYLALAARQDGWFVRSIIIWSKTNPMPESQNGWRWERHKIKIKAQRTITERDKVAIGYGRRNIPHVEKDYEYVDCPGCPKCNPNDGYVLRKGSWRPTDSFEYILMLTKTSDYFCDKGAVTEVSIDKESHTGRRERSYSRSDYEVIAQGKKLDGRNSKDTGKTYPRRNMRSVWTFPTESFPGAHFAVYPSKLPELCIKASTSEAGCCPSCGAPYARIMDKGEPLDNWKKAMGADSSGEYHGKARKDYAGAKAQDASELKSRILAGAVEKITSGWRPTCKCPPHDPFPCWVLDPFSGAGTTALAAERLGRDSVNIDTSDAYNEMAKARLVQDRKK